MIGLESVQTKQTIAKETVLELVQLLHSYVLSVHYGDFKILDSEIQKMCSDLLHTNWKGMLPKHQ